MDKHLYYLRRNFSGSRYRPSFMPYAVITLNRKSIALRYEVKTWGAPKHMVLKEFCVPPRQNVSFMCKAIHIASLYDNYTARPDKLPKILKSRLR